MQAMITTTFAPGVPEKYAPLALLQFSQFPFPALDSGGFDFILNWRP
jgi:hypothetical protein